MQKGSESFRDNVSYPEEKQPLGTCAHVDLLSEMA